MSNPLPVHIAGDARPSVQLSKPILIKEVEQFVTPRLGGGQVPFIKVSMHFESLHRVGCTTDGRAHPDQAPLSASCRRSRPDRGAPDYRLRHVIYDLVGVAALIAIIYGALYFPELVR